MVSFMNPVSISRRWGLFQWRCNQQAPNEAGDMIAKLVKDVPNILTRSSTAAIAIITASIA
jgi:hypothetical protein